MEASQNRFGCPFPKNRPEKGRFLRLFSKYQASCIIMSTEGVWTSETSNSLENQFGLYSEVKACMSYNPSRKFGFQFIEKAQILHTCQLLAF